MPAISKTPFEDDDRFRIIRHLGKGAMGDVYLARDDVRGEQVAVKVLTEPFRDEPIWREHLKFQAAIVGRISNPHIAAIYELAERGRTAFLVMEYVDGQTLRECLRERMSVSQVLRLAVDCTEALGAAHTVGIVHHDIKPENIMLTGAGRSVKVCDFGVARPLPGAVRAHRGAAGALPHGATPAYVAPEVLLGEEADGRADIYSLGIVLYEALARRHPFPPGIYTWPTLEAPAPPPIRVLNPQVPAELEAVVNRMLQERPEDRFSSAADLLKSLRDLQHTLHEQENAGTRPLDTQHLGLRSRASLKRWMPHAILLMALGVIGLLWSRTSPDLPDLKAVAVLPFTTAGGSATGAAYCGGVADVLTGRLTRLTSSTALQVVPSAEVRLRGVTSASDARRELGATLVVEGRCTERDGTTQVAMLLRDPQSQRVLRRGTVTMEQTGILTAGNQLFRSATRMLNVDPPTDAPPPSLPRNAETYQLYLRGRGLLVEYADPKNIDGSIDTFTRALKLDPTFAPAQASMGEAYWRKFEQTRDRLWLEAARQSCDRAVSLDNSLAAAHVCLGTVFNGIDRFQEAVGEFRLAVDLEPTNDDAYRGLARAFEGLRDPKQAQQAYQRAIAIRPTYWAGYNWLGAFYNDRGCYEEAAAEFSNALALSPGNARLLYNRGAVHAVSGRYSEAVADLTDSIALRPSSTAYLNLGTVYFRLRNFEAAAAAYERAAESAGTQFRVASSLAYGYYYWKPSWHTKGVAASRRAIDLGLRELSFRPHDSATHARLAVMHALLGEQATAEGHLSEVIRSTSVTGASAFLAAVAAKHLGNTATALGWLERAVNLRYPPAEIRIAVEFQDLTGAPGFERILRLGLVDTSQHLTCDAS